jgi:UDP-N-acetylglucosamine acyltransferase
MSSARIHPTAIVDATAQIGNDAVIGPYAQIGAHAKIGARSAIASHVVIEPQVTIGTDNVVDHAAIIGTAPQDLSYSADRKTRVEIGNENVIREHCTIHRGTTDGSATTIGDKNFLMAGAHVGHNCEIGNNVIVANNCLLGGYVRVADNAFLGGGCVFHQNIRVGRLAITQGASAFSKDIPPFVIAAERNYVFGLNVIGLRRCGFTAEEREQIKAAFRLIYNSGLNISDALEQSKKISFAKAAQEFIDFIADAKKRGVCALKRGVDENDL